MMRQKTIAANQMAKFENNSQTPTESLKTSYKGSETPTESLQTSYFGSDEDNESEGKKKSPDHSQHNSTIEKDAKVNNLKRGELIGRTSSKRVKVAL